MIQTDIFKCSYLKFLKLTAEREIEKILPVIYSDEILDELIA